MHERQVIHRDIKPDNVFLSARGLVLGDFGIVFWVDARQERLTETYERVGSRDWMAPWANRGRRLADVNPTFDIFPLGKLLWAMISGQRELPYWDWDQPEFNLENLFPASPGMDLVNSRILAHTVVQREPSCQKSAAELLQRVRALLSVLERGGQNLGSPARPCRICGMGHYADFRGGQPQLVGVLDPEKAKRLNQAEFVYRDPEMRMTLRVQVCDQCGHAEFFHFADGGRPAAWKK